MDISPLDMNLNVMCDLLYLQGQVEDCQMTRFDHFAE